MIEVNESQIRVMRIIARMNVGGPAVQITGLMKFLNSKEFEQRLYTGFCDPNEADYLEIVAPDIPVYRVKGLGRSINILSDLKAIALLIKEIRDFKPHIIHTHTAKAGVIGRIASLISRQKSLRAHTYHGHLLYGYFGKFKTKLVVIVEKVLSFTTHELVAVGINVRQDLLKAGIGRLNHFRVIPPGLEIHHLPEKAIARKKLGISSEKLQAAYIGRVTQIKRPDRFLDLVFESKFRDLEIEFLIAGDGELLEYCRERISREKLPVNVLGWQSNIELVLAASDIVILTSDNEGTPLSLIQAGMAGLPVLTTNVGSVSEVVLHNDTGITSNAIVSDLADELERLVTNENLRLSLGKSAVKFTNKNFSVLRLARDHELLYKNMMANQASS